MENHERRRDRLEEILQETIDKVAAHEAGREKFKTDEEYETMRKRIGLYQKKLERMKKPLDDRVSKSCNAGQCLSIILECNSHLFEIQSTGY